MITDEIQADLRAGEPAYPLGPSKATQAVHLETYPLSSRVHFNKNIY